MLDLFCAMRRLQRQDGSVELRIQGGGRLPDLIVTRVAIVDDIVLIVGQNEDGMGGMNDRTPSRITGASGRGQLYAFDAHDQGFQQGMYMIHKAACHEAAVTALGGWTDPYCGDIRSLSKDSDPNDPKAPHPYGRIITGSETGIISVWALCCGERLAAWRAHEGAVNHVLALPNSDIISCSEDGTVKVWGMIESLATKAEVETTPHQQQQQQQAAVAMDETEGKQEVDTPMHEVETKHDDERETKVEEPAVAEQQQREEEEVEESDREGESPRGDSTFRTATSMISNLFSSILRGSRSEDTDSGDGMDPENLPAAAGDSSENGDLLDDDEDVPEQGVEEPIPTSAKEEEHQLCKILPYVPKNPNGKRTSLTAHTSLSLCLLFSPRLCFISPSRLWG